MEGGSLIIAQQNRGILCGVDGLYGSGQIKYLIGIDILSTIINCNLINYIAGVCNRRSLSISLLHLFFASTLTERLAVSVKYQHVIMSIIRRLIFPARLI